MTYTKIILLIIIPLIIAGITANSIVEKQRPYQVVIQDIWIIDETRSEKWLDFLKNANVKIDDTHIYMYTDRDSFNKKVKELCQQY